MGMSVQVDLPPFAVEMSATVQRALLEGMELFVLPAAVAGAPVEPEAKHGVHLRETGYARLDGEFRGEVGFKAFWALWQELDIDYHHDVGHAKFTELALAQHSPQVLELIAERLSELLA